MNKEFWIIIGVGVVFVIAMMAIKKSTQGFTCPSGATCSQPATLNRSGIDYANTSAASARPRS